MLVTVAGMNGPPHYKARLAIAATLVDVDRSILHSVYFTSERGNQQCSSCQGVIADLAPPSNVQHQNTVQTMWAAFM